MNPLLPLSPEDEVRRLQLQASIDQGEETPAVLEELHRRAIASRKAQQMPKKALANVLERDFQASIIEAAHLHGWRVHAERPARTAKGWATPIQGDPGFVDIVLVKGTQLLHREVKTERGFLTADQAAWILALQEAGADTGVWRPGDFPRILETLRGA